MAWWRALSRRFWTRGDRQGNGVAHGSTLSLVTLAEPRSVSSEAYRSLRTNLQFTRLHGNLQTILVTSSGQGEGKTTTVCNLAVALAQAGQRVLVVDADLRQPTVHRTFGLDNGRGLTSVLATGASLDDAVSQSQVEGLDVLPSGPIPPNPSELVGLPQVDELLRAAAQRYDVILIDTPPVLAVTDAVVLAPHVDGVILVARAGETRREALVQARDALQKAEARILGVVLNAIQIGGPGYDYYSYYGYYGHGAQG